MDLDFIPEDEGGLNDFLDKIESEGGDALSQKVLEWDKAIRIISTGRPDAPKRDDYAQFRANIIRPTARRKGALLTENKPELDVLPLTEGFGDVAHALKNVMQAGWEEMGVQAMLDDIGYPMLQVLNSAFAEMAWDPNAAYGNGNIQCGPVDPRQVIVDPSIVRARDFDRAQYYRVRTVPPLHTIAALYPAVADELKPTNKILATERDLERPGGGIGGALARITNRLSTGRSSQHRDPPIPRVQLDTYWFRDPRTNDGEAVYPGGRCVVRANDDVICTVDEFSAETLRNETQNPYYDGLWPHEWLDNIPDIDSPWGQDEVCAARYIQSTFDQIGNTTVQTMLVNSRPFVHAPKNALDNATVNMLEKLGHVVLQYTAGRGDVTRQASPIPTGVYLQLMQICQSILEYTQGLQDAGGGIPAKGRAEVRSSAMLEGLQSAAQVLIRAQARRLEDFLQRLGQKWISRIFQFLTMDRLMWYVGAQGTQKYAFQRAKITDQILDAALKEVVAQHQREAEKRRREITDTVVPLIFPTAPPTHLDDTQHLAAIKGAWRNFRFHIVPYSSLAATKVSRFQEKMQLFGQAMLPASDVMEELGYHNPHEKVAKAVEEAKERQALGVPGIMPPPKDKKGGKKAA